MSQTSYSLRLYRALSIAGTLVGLCAAAGAAQAQNNTIFGPNVYVFDQNTNGNALQTALSKLNTQAEFGTSRYAVLFKPGSYNFGTQSNGTALRISSEGFYEQIAGLGTTPDQVSFTGNFDVGQADSNGNGTDNFWRSQENMEVSPNGEGYWGVAQGASYRRMHVAGNLQLTNYQCGYASGGFISNSLVDGELYSCSEQQYYVRNTQMKTWKGNNWNMVFSGDTGGVPAQDFGNGGNSYTTLSTTPVAREKPFLYLDSGGNFQMFVPALKTNSSGYDWANGLGSGTSLPMSAFFIATPSSAITDINNALASGKNLILTPGIYNLAGTIKVTNPNTLVYGMGYATLVPQGAFSAISTADVDGVILAGLLIDAGPNTGQSTLVDIGGNAASTVSHASNPPQLDDVFFRVGGLEAGTAQTSLQIDANNTIMDNIWAWRADHGNAGTVGWTTNTAAHGLVVNGNNVLATGLAVEHYQQSQVVWNGNNGETIFYQSELPYDPPSQAAWMDGGARGYPSYQVTACAHTAYGLGIYSYFNQNQNIYDDSAITTPNTTGIQFTDMVTVYLAGSGGIAGIINNTGGSVQSGAKPDYLKSYAGSGACTTTTAPAAPTNLVAKAVSTSQINLTWTASTTPGVYYEIFQSTTNPATVSESNLLASTANTSYSATGLKAGTTYYYSVVAVASFVSAPAQASATTQGSGVSINTGGGSVSGFIADTDFSGGSVYSNSTPVTVAGVANAAPAAVYQDEREGVFTYTIPGFTAGSSHTVSLYFAELYFSTAGSRKFNVAINGTQVLTNFDIVQQAGASHKAVTAQFTATANASGNIVIAFTRGSTDQPTVSGLSIQ